MSGKNEFANDFLLFVIALFLIAAPSASLLVSLLLRTLRRSPVGQSLPHPTTP